MRHRNIFRLTVITILTLLAAISSVLVAVSYWNPILWPNSDFLNDPASWRAYSVLINHRILELSYEREVPDGEPWARWRLGFKNFSIGVHTFSGKNNKAAWRYHYLHVPLVVLVLAFAAYPFVAFVRGRLRRYRRFRRRKRNQCIKCGYDLTGNVSGVCPECGEAADTSEC